MSTKQARLISAVSDAMNAQGGKAVDLAKASGSSQGTISSAMSGKAQMKDERWRMICEYLHIDFDEIVADVAPPRRRMSSRIMRFRPSKVSQPPARIRSL